jgi:hypothetical protein
MNKEEFLARPLQCLLSKHEFTPPPDWISAAWQQFAFQQEAVYALSHSVSKTGSLQGASDWISLLSSALTPQDAKELYLAIRNNSQRSESEWRDEFKRAFPGSTALLPEIDRGRELFNKTLGLFCAIYWAEPDKIQKRMQALLDQGFQLDEAK